MEPKPAAEPSLAPVRKQYVRAFTRPGWGWPASATHFWPPTAINFAPPFNSVLGSRRPKRPFLIYLRSHFFSSFSSLFLGSNEFALDHSACRLAMGWRYASRCCVRARGSPGRAGAMSAAAAAPALPAAAPQQIEEEEERDGTTHFLVRWLPAEPAAAEPSWVSAAQVVGRPEFEGVLQEWEVAKASGLAAAQEGSSDDDGSGDDSGEEGGAAAGGGEEEGPDERLQELGMAAAVKAAESGGTCEEAALAAADSVRAAGGSEEEAIAVRSTHFSPLLSVPCQAVPCRAERVGCVG
eukprot:COSAG04_NODE_7551_length_1109_cov_1.225743_1_plen_294_part_01